MWILSPLISLLKRIIPDHCPNNTPMTAPTFWQSLRDNDYFIWFNALLLSLAIHVIFFIKPGNINAAPSNVIKETITHVRFSTLAPPPVKVIEPVTEQPRPEPVVPPKPVVIKKPEPKSIKKPKKRKTPKPKPKKAKRAIPKKPRPKPQAVTQKPPVEQQKKPVQQPLNAQNNQLTKNQPVSASPVIAKADPRLLEQTRTSYLSLLMRHIEVHKHYPRVARKRKIQGDILVSFTLLKQGKISNLQVIGSKSLLKRASMEAVHYALPLPTPPDELTLPMEIKFKMNYFLK